MNEKTLTVLPGDRDQHEKEVANELLHALLIQKDVKAAKKVVEKLAPRGELELVSTKKLKQEQE